MRTIAVLVLGFSLVAPSSGEDAGKVTRPPNIVLVFADDQGYGDLGCYGGRPETPNLDRVAKEGVRFTDFYVAQPVCSSSRVALMTGCYSNRLGITGALGPNAKHGLHPEETTIAEVLKTKGYATAVFGKWHLGHHPQHLPGKHGFDEYFGLPYSNDMWPHHPTAKFPDLPLIEGDKIIEKNPDQTKLTTWYAERAVKFIEKNKDKPFFLYVAHNMPHVPLFVSDKFKGKSKGGLYGDVTMEVDWSVGQILEALKKNGLEEDTLFVYTSDNGPWLSYGDHGGSAGKLREGKGTCWEGGVRVPCVARWPGKIAAGSVCREPGMTIDLLPTFAHVAGAELPKRAIDGKNVWDLMAGKAGAKSPHEALWFYWLNDLRAVRSGNLKLVLPHKYPHPNPAGSGGKPGKMEQRETELALFDLTQDAGETTNLAGKRPEEVKRLQALAEKALEELGDQSKGRKGKGVREPARVE